MRGSQLSHTWVHRGRHERKSAITHMSTQRAAWEEVSYQTHEYTKFGKRMKSAMRHANMSPQSMEGSQLSHTALRRGRHERKSAIRHMSAQSTQRVAWEEGATRSITVSTPAFLACHQCYCAGSSLAWGWNLRTVVRGIFWSSWPGVFSGYSGFLPSLIGLPVQTKLK